MSMEYKVAVIGGDKRLMYLAKQLEEEGYDIRTHAIDSQSECEIAIHRSLEEVTSEADIIVGPVPFSKDGIYLFTKSANQISLEELGNALSVGQIVFGGNIPNSFKEKASENKVIVYDFMEMEEIAVKNAIATAEGTIAEAIILSDINLYESNCIVLGFGRCAKALAVRLQALGACVTVAARNKDQRMKAEALGLRSIDLVHMDACLDQADFVFNTVPAMLLPEEKIRLLRQEAVIVDIASKPGGTDFDACKTFNIKSCLALGLPGKYAPKTSAEILVNGMRHLLHLS